MMIWRKKKEYPFLPQTVSTSFPFVVPRRDTNPVHTTQRNDISFPIPQAAFNFATDFGGFFSSKTIPCQLITCIITVPTSIVSLAIQEWSCLQSSRSGQRHLVSSSTEWLPDSLWEWTLCGAADFAKHGVFGKKTFGLFYGQTLKAIHGPFFGKLFSMA